MVKDLPANSEATEKAGLIDPWVEKMPWRRTGNQLQDSWLGDPMVREDWPSGPWGREELDTAECTHTHTHLFLNCKLSP